MAKLHLHILCQFLARKFKLFFIDFQPSFLLISGNLVDWWHPVTKEKYVKKAECIIKQYGNYSLPGLGLNLSGINTQGENIADNGGIKEAYRAYSKSD